MTQNQIIEEQSLQKILQISESINGTLEDLDLTSEVTENLPDSLEYNKNRIFSLYSQFNSIFNPIKDVFLADFQTAILKEIQSQAKPNRTQKMGLSLLGNQSLERNLGSTHLVSSISRNYWSKLENVLLKSEKFKPILSNLQNFYLKFLDKQVDLELSKVPMEIDDGIREEYRKLYYTQRLSFEQFLDLNKPTDNFSSTDEDSRTLDKSEQLRKDFEQALEHKKLEQAKDKQQKSFDDYKEYFNMNDRELERAKRRSANKRKFSKKSRRGKYK